VQIGSLTGSVIPIPRFEGPVLFVYFVVPFRFRADPVLVTAVLLSLLPCCGVAGPGELETRAVVERVYVEELGRYPDEAGLRIHAEFLLDEDKDEAWLRDHLRHSEEGRAYHSLRRNRIRILAGVIVGVILSGGVLSYVNSRTPKGFFFKGILFFGGVLTACLFVEGILRIQAFRDDQRDASAWRNLSRVRMPAPGDAVLLPHIIRPAAFTVVGLGDSVMFGWGVNDNQTCLARLAAGVPEPSLRAVNLSVPGYNTALEVESFMQYGLPENPGLVILHYVDNDLEIPSFLLKPDTHLRLTRSHLLAAVAQWTGARIHNRPFDRLVRVSEASPPEYAHLEGEEMSTRSMERLCEACAQRSIPVVILCNWTTPPHVQSLASSRQIPVLSLGPILLRYCRDQGIEEFQGSALTVSETDPHFSVLAHQLVADALVAFLNDLNLLPGAAQ